MPSLLRLWFTAIALTLSLTACVANNPSRETVVRPPDFERTWTAAIDAMGDTGIAVSQINHNQGRLQGVREGARIFVLVIRVPGGTARVEPDPRDYGQQNWALFDEFMRAFRRRIGN